MQKKKNVMLANDIVNLTDGPICMYDVSTGCIKKFEPTDVKDVAEIVRAKENQNRYYVVDDCSTLMELMALGGNINNVAFVAKRSIGRGNKTISYLVWAIDRRIVISYRGGLRYV